MPGMMAVHVVWPLEPRGARVAVPHCLDPPRPAWARRLRHRREDVEVVGGKIAGHVSVEEGRHRPTALREPLNALEPHLNVQPAEPINGPKDVSIAVAPVANVLAGHDAVRAAAGQGLVASQLTSSAANRVGEVLRLRLELYTRRTPLAWRNLPVPAYPSVASPSTGAASTL